MSFVAGLLCLLSIAPASAVAAQGDGGLVQGTLFYEYYQGRWKRLPDFDTQPRAGYGLSPGLSIDPVPLDRDYGVRFTGYIQVPSDGEYAFYTRSDDGSALFIDGTLVVDNDGLHGMRARKGSIVLAAGEHEIEAQFFQRGGGEGLEVGYLDEAGNPVAIDPADLAHDPATLPQPKEPDLPEGDLYAGVAYEYVEDKWSELPDFDTLDPVLEGASDGFVLDERLRDYKYGFRYQGYLEVPEDGIYTFYTNSDDGSALYIGDRLVVDNDGLHAPRERAGAISLLAGTHRITVEFFQKWGGAVLDVSWAGPGLDKQSIPAEALTYTMDMLPPLKPADVPASPLVAGLAVRYFEGVWKVLPDFDDPALEPVTVGVQPGFSLEQATSSYKMGFSFQGYIEVPEDGIYRFYTNSDDGSTLRIGEQLVVDNDGAHGPRQRFGVIALEAGVHQIRVDYFQRWGGKTLAVEYMTPDGTVAAIPEAALFHTAEQLPALNAALDEPEGLESGLAYAYFEGKWRSINEMIAGEPLANGVSDGFDLAPRADDNKFGFVYTGYLRVPEDGFYRFFTESDDGSDLWIDGMPVVDNDGLHGAKTRYGSVGLAAGLHEIEVRFFERWGNQLLRVGYQAPSGAETEIAAADLLHTAGQLPELIPAVELPAAARPGLAYGYYEGKWRTLPDFDSLEPQGVGVVEGFSLAPASNDNKYGFVFDGYVLIPEDGFYDFQTRSDDGSRLWIGDAMVVDNDGLHGMRSASGNIGLAAGWHPLRVGYFERWGADALEVSWRAAGSGDFAPIPADALVFDPALLPDLEAADAVADALVAGIDYEYYEGKWKVLPDFDTLTPVDTGAVDGFSLAPRQSNDRYGFRFSGYIDIPEYGFYTFYTSSDDGSQLFIGDQLVVDNDGLHGMRERSGRIGLEAGRHAITVTFFERGGADNLIVSYAGPSFAKTAVTPAVLFRLDPDGNGDPGDPGEPGGPGDPGANQAPIAQPDQAATGIGAGQSLSVDVLANDSDPDGDILLLIGIEAGSAAGSAYVDQASAELRYVPPLGFVGVDRIGYVVSDRRGGTATGEVTISVGQDGAAPVMSAEDAVRLLTQATFGPTEAGIVRAMEIGAEAWIDEQLALPASLHAPFVIEAGSASRELRVEAWIERALAAPDQLRQRVAFALSEILVVSDLGNDLGTDDGALGATEYYDIMVRNAFGDYRQLLEEVTLHPAMGLFLNMAGNRKADPILGTVPDENYAREILQLFSVGLWRLNPDGTRVLDGDGEPVASYTEEDVMEFARIFTGWNFAVESGPDRLRLAMVLDPALHDDDEKQLLDGEIAPAGQGGWADLAQALDNIAADGNVGPFIARQLIQRLVTSNPSPAYVGRAAAAFDAGGGDLGAMVRAILLDPEARSASPDPLDALVDADPDFVPPGPAYGKIREPLLQLTALWRGLGLADDAEPDLADLRTLGQVPLSAPSVFNFFKPDYQNPGEITELGLYSPELELIDEKQVISSARVIDDWTLGAERRYDLSQEQAMAASGAARFIDHLDLLFLGGQMSPIMRETLADEMLDGDARSCRESRWDCADRLLGSVYLILTSPEFQTQR